MIVSSPLAVGPGQLLILFKHGATLNPIPVANGFIPPHDGGGEQHFAFGVPAEAFADWMAVLGEKGIAIESVIDWPQGGRSLYFRDPDRLLVELVTPAVEELLRDGDLMAMKIMSLTDAAAERIREIMEDADRPVVGVRRRQECRLRWHGLYARLRVRAAPKAMITSTTRASTSGSSPRGDAVPARHCHGFQGRQAFRRLHLREPQSDARLRLR